MNQTMEKLSEIFEENLVNSIRSTPSYDEETLLSLIPYLSSNEKNDLTDLKLYILGNNPSFFFRYGKNVEGVPDLRFISEETRNAMRISVWNPWKNLVEEMDSFLGAEERGDSSHQTIYEYLMEQSDSTIPNVNDFLFTYPVICYCILNENGRKAVLVDYPFIHLLKNVDYTLAGHARSKKMVDFLLKDIEPTKIIEKKNPWIMVWLIERNEPSFFTRSDLYETFSQIDCVEALCLLPSDQIGKFDEWIKYLVRNASVKMIEWFLERDEKVYHAFINYVYDHCCCKLWILHFLIEKYGNQRFHKEYDLLEIALQKGTLEDVARFPVASLMKPIIEYKEVIHPIVYSLMYQHKNTLQILKYLYSTIDEEEKGRLEDEVTFCAFQCARENVFKDIVNFLDDMYDISPYYLLKVALSKDEKNAALNILTFYDIPAEDVKELFITYLKRY